MKEGMNMKNNNYIGEIINNERIRQGMSIRKLSRLTGISPTTICDLVMEIQRNMYLKQY